MTALPARTRDQLLERSRGGCELCGHRATNVHHRKPRGMGGTRQSDIHALTNLLHLCGTGTTGCHGAIEADRARAHQYGWLVSQWQDPAQVPVRIPGGWVYLLPTGAYALAHPPKEAPPP